MNKKAIAILGVIFVLIVGTLGFLIYSKYYSNKAAAPANLADNNNDTANPPAPNPPDGTNPTPTPGPSLSPTPPTEPTPAGQNPSSSVYKLTDDSEQVLSPALFNNGAVVMYFDLQGNMFQAQLAESNGKLDITGKKQVDIPLKSKINKILWPAKGDDFIVEIKQADGSARYSYYSRNTNTYTDLPPQVESLGWMPGGDKIIYVWAEKGKASLAISDPDTKNYKTLGDMWELDDTVRVSPSGSQVAYYQTQNPAADNKINSVTVDGKIWKTLIASGQNLGVLWSPDSQKFLFTKKDLNTQQYQLWVYNVASGQIKNLQIFTTVDKAVWDSDSATIYAAAPNSGTTGDNNLTVDSFYKVNVDTQDTRQYIVSSPAVDGRDLFLNPAGDRVFFRNAQDGGLYYLDLAK